MQRERNAPGPRPSCLCGECDKCKRREAERQRRQRPEMRERQRQASAERYRSDPAVREKIVAAKRERRASDPDAYAEEMRRQSRVARAKPEYKGRHALRQRTHRAIAAGVLVRQPCESCGTEKVEAHHEDYTDHLNVRWLCRICHMREHRSVPEVS